MAVREWIPNSWWYWEVWEFSLSFCWVDAEVHRCTQKGGQLKVMGPLLLDEHGNHSAAFHRSQHF